MNKRQFAMLLCSSSGDFGLLARAADLHARQRGGNTFLSIEAGETVLTPAVVASPPTSSCSSSPSTS